MAAVPLLKLNVVQPDLYAVGVTGSTGAGRAPIATTHHPERHSNLFAYQPLTHRHAPEVIEICEQITGTRPRLHFIPHSGPFARGIHMTVQAPLKNKATMADLQRSFQEFYAGSPFVSVTDAPPRLKDVLGSNYCRLGLATHDGSAAVMVVLDNLVKGAAGGAIQWLNRKLGFAETAGLTQPAVGWL
jgi:N-acetyl-gamma-glutamyl-phosphate reductase